MILLIGGAGQGKLAYALKKTGFGPENAIEAIRKEFDTVLQQEKPINQ